MNNLFQSTWIITLAGAIIYLIATLVFWNSPFDGMVPHDEAEKMASMPWDFQNPEVDQLLAELKKERDHISKRQQELGELELRLKTERLELNQLLQNIQQMQGEFDRMVVRIHTEETANLKKLAKMYSAMAPETAITILKELDDVSFIKILLFMKEPEIAPILETLSGKGGVDAKRAASLSEQLRLSLSRNP